MNINKRQKYFLLLKIPELSETSTIFQGDLILSLIQNKRGDELKLLIAYGSQGKFFHLKEFADALEKLDVKTMLVKDTDFSDGFPSKRPQEWFGTNKKFKNLIHEFAPDAVFIDRQSHFGIDVIKAKIPLFVLLRGHYWSEIEWAKETLYKEPVMRSVISLRKKLQKSVLVMLLLSCLYANTWKMLLKFIILNNQHFHSWRELMLNAGMRLLQIS